MPHLHPPRLARTLLRHLLPPRDREFLIGDLEESFVARASGEGLRAARRWYWRAALASVAALREREPEWRPVPIAHAKGDSFVSNIIRDIRQGMRLLGRSPGFSVVAILTLALGIGANTAIFTITHGILLKPLPYTDADRIVLMTENNFSRGWSSFTVAPANFLDWRKQSASFDTLSAWGSRSFNYSGGDSGTPERLRALAGTAGFLEILDGKPIKGRAFQSHEFEPGNEFVVILSHGFWQRAFGGRDDVLNQKIVLNGQPYEVVGIMHPGWRFGARDVSAFVPRAMQPDEMQVRGGHYLSVVGRLKTEVSVETARAELTTIASRLETQYPGTNKGWGVNLTPLFEAAVGGFRPLLGILLGAVGVVLLVACANLANMHLARATGRAREMAIRAAIGAGRLRIVQQLLTESLVLTAIGAALGLGIAYLGTTLFISTYPTLLPRSRDIGIDAPVLMFTAGLSILTALLFGLAPAVAAARTRFNDTLKDGARGGGGRLRVWMRNGLVVTEVALALVLLAGAGLLLRSFVHLGRVDPGFETDHRLSALVQLPQPQYGEPARVADFFDRTIERLRAEPGIEGVALASIVPGSGLDEIYSIEFEGRPPFEPGKGVSALYYLVSPNYFDMMGIPVRRGRPFNETDRDGSPRVAVINETFARLHYPGEDPVGKRIRMGRNSTIVREIVGVVGDVKHYGLTDRETAQMYEPFNQMPAGAMNIIVKASGDAANLGPVVRRQVKATDADQPVATLTTLDQMMADAGALPRVQTTLMGALGAIALLLAAVGLYGVMAYSVSQRTQEIGIRMTLGAQRGSVLRMVLVQALGLTGLGLVLGLAAAFVLGGLLEATLEPILFQVTATDAATFAGVSVTLALVSLIAALIPARRATRVDPVRALRST